MSNGVFTITEIPAGGDPDIADLLGLRFEWTADSRPITPFHGSGGGGARACPVKPWRQGGTLRTKRTDYPNAKIPSEQVLGPVHKRQTFSGRWDDRYNGAGYAKFERDRFVEMCERSNPVRIQYDTDVFVGLIVDWDCDVNQAWKIPYTFVVSVHNRPAQTDRTRVIATPPDPVSSLNDVIASVQALLDSDQFAPRHAVTGGLTDDVTELLVANVTAHQQLADTIDNRDLNLPTHPVDGMLRIATLFRQQRGHASDLLDRLATTRADLDTTLISAMDVLNFEDWTRSLRWNARIVMHTSHAGDLAASEAATPPAVRLYRPQRGEHLYAISRQFYGSPHGWRLIYDVNALTSFTLTGAEILIIPERGGV